MTKKNSSPQEADQALLPSVAEIKFKEANLPVLANSDTATTLMSKYTPFMAEVLEKVEALKVLKKEDAQDCASAKRIALDIGKICSRLETQKKEDKAEYVVVTKFIDGLFNSVEGLARMTQAEAKQISDYFENLEKARLTKLQEDRATLVIPFLPEGTPVSPDLCNMSEEMFATFLLGYEAKFNEAKKVAEEQSRLKKEEDEKQALELSRLQKEAEEAKAKQEGINSLSMARNKQLAAINYTPLIITGELSEKEFEILLKRETTNYNKALKEEEARKEALAKDQAANLLAQTRLNTLIKLNCLKSLEELKGLTDAEFAAIHLKANTDFQEESLKAKKMAEELEKAKVAEAARVKKEAEEKAAATEKARLEAIEKARLEALSDKAVLKEKIKAFTLTLEAPSEKSAALVKDILLKFEGFKTWASGEVEKQLK